MTTVAYIANAFPSPVEPYVMDEISELRRRGLRVICCSAERVSREHLNADERNFRHETHSIGHLLSLKLAAATRRLAGARKNLQPVLLAALHESERTKKRGRIFAHTLLGAGLASDLAPFDVRHIHAHHGYYSSWMALIASRLLGSASASPCTVPTFSCMKIYSPPNCAFAGFA